RQKAEESRKQARKLRRLVWALGGLLMLAIIAIVFAFHQRAVAHARQFVASSVSNEDSDPELSVLFAADAVGATWPWGHSVLPEAEDELHRALIESRVRLTLRGHGSSVASVTWSPDGRRLATASGDKMTKVWDATSGQEVLTLHGHGASIGSVAWSPDGKRLATGSDDETAKIWDATSGQELLTLRGHSDVVRSVAWSSDGKRLATASGDRTAKVWDTATGQELLTLRGHDGAVMSVAWNLDGK